MTDKTPQGDAPEGIRVHLAPVSDVSESQPGMLTLAYTDGVPTLIVTDGNAVPEGIAVVDDAGNQVALYTAGPVPTTRHLAVPTNFQVS